MEKADNSLEDLYAMAIFSVAAIGKIALGLGRSQAIPLSTVREIAELAEKAAALVRSPDHLSMISSSLYKVIPDIGPAGMKEDFVRTQN